MKKIKKTIDPKKTYISIDVESNGLHGSAFCIAAVVNIGGKVVLEYVSKRIVNEEIDEFVKNAGIIEKIKSIDCEEFDTPAEMFIDFKEKVLDVYCKDDEMNSFITHLPYPVEANLFEDVRFYSGKDLFIQLFDVSVLLDLIGKDPTSIDSYIGEEFPDVKIDEHNPLYDANAAMLVFFDILN